MKCMQCGGEMVVAREDRPHADLPHVVLHDLEVRRCPACGEGEEVIPRLEQLHQVLASALVAKRARLSPEEIRFLRESIGWTQPQLAGRLGVTPESLSRWESGDDVMGPVADRLLRMLAAAHIEGAAPPGEALAAIADDVVPLADRLRFGSDGWRVAGDSDPSEAWASVPAEDRTAVLQALAPERFSEKQRTAVEAAIAVLTSAARPREAA